MMEVVRLPEDRLAEWKLITFMIFVFLPIGGVSFFLIRAFRVWGIMISLIIVMIGVWLVYLYWRRMFD